MMKEFRVGKEGTHAPLALELYPLEAALPREWEGIKARVGGLATGSE